jgi:hypothetical protein
VRRDVVLKTQRTDLVRLAAIGAGGRNCFRHNGRDGKRQLFDGNEEKWKESNPAERAAVILKQDSRF